jgi:hypothetical protein
LLFFYYRILAIANPGQLQGTLPAEKGALSIRHPVDPDDTIFGPVVEGLSDLESSADQGDLSITDAEDISWSIMKKLRLQVLLPGDQFESESDSTPEKGRAPECLFLV